MIKPTTRAGSVPAHAGRIVISAHAVDGHGRRRRPPSSWRSSRKTNGSTRWRHADGHTEPLTRHMVRPPSGGRHPQA